MKPLPGHRIRETTLATGFREVIWSDIREGLPRLHDLVPATRVLGVLGILAIVAATLQLLFVDALRSQSALIAGHVDLGGRAQLVPLELVPLALATLVVAWTYLLSGAMRAHPLVTAGVLTLFAATTLVWIAGSGTGAAPGQHAVPVLAVVMAMAITIGGRFLPARRQFLPFAALLACVAAAHAATATLHDGGLDTVAVETPVVTLGLLFSLARGLALPLLVVLGFGLALFAYRVASWIGDTAVAAGHASVLPAMIGLMAAATVVATLAAVVRSWGESSWASWMGALLFVALPVAIGVAARRWPAAARAQDSVDETALVDAAEGVIPTVAAAFFAPLVVVTIGLLVASAVGAAVQIGGGLGLPQETEAALNRAVDTVTRYTDVYRVLFVVGAAIAGATLVRRRPTLGIYLLVLGAAQGWAAAVAGGPLVALRWDDASQIAAWLAVGVLAMLAVDVRRGALPRLRQRNYVVALGIVLLFGQVGILENPFHPVFAFTGVALVTAAVALDTLTLGSWANVETPRLPRHSRLLLYVGYALLSLTLVTWAAGTHDFEQFELFTGEAAAGGLRLFGDPLLLTLLAVLVLGRGASSAVDADGRSSLGAEDHH